MLKFSGFADLTSCLGRSPKGLWMEGLPSQATQQKASETLCKLYAAKDPHALDASGALP